MQFNKDYCIFSLFFAVKFDCVIFKVYCYVPVLNKLKYNFSRPTFFEKAIKFSKMLSTSTVILNKFLKTFLKMSGPWPL